MTESRATLLIRVSATLKSRLVDIAKRERRSLSKQVELLLEHCLENEEKSPAVRSPRVGRKKES